MNSNINFCVFVFVSRIKSKCSFFKPLKKTSKILNIFNSNNIKNKKIKINTNNLKKHKNNKKILSFKKKCAKKSTKIIKRYYLDIIYILSFVKNCYIVWGDIE